MKTKAAKLELGDLLDLALCIALASLYWIVLGGWAPGYAVVGQGDALEYVYPYLQLLRDLAPGEVPLYDPGIIGGAKLAGTWVSPWFLKLALAFRLPLSEILSLLGVLPQVLFGFCSLKALDGLLSWKRAEDEPMSPLRRALWAAFFLFQPFLAWRISQGHFAHWHSSLLAPALLALLLGAKRRTFGGVGVFVVLLTIYGAFESISYQQLLNSAVFAGPLLALVFWKVKAIGASPGKDRKWGVAALFLLALAGAFFTTMTEQWEFVRHFLSSDASRHAGGPNVVFSWTTLSLPDLVAALSWRMGVVETGREAFELHETNFPLGVLAVFLILGTRERKLRGLVYAFVGALAIALLFSLRFGPVTGPLLALIKPLGMFRVPMRTLWPLLLVAPALAAATLESRFPGSGQHRREAWLWFLAAAALAFGFLFLPPAAMEIALWTLALAVALVPRFGSRFFGAALVFLVAGALQSFDDRVPAPIDLRATAHNTAALRARILELSPDLENPLTRAALRFEDKKFYSNTPRVLGIAALDGYWHPQRRFVQLWSAAEVKEFHEMQLNFRALIGSPALGALGRLYNVTSTIEQDDAGKLLRVPSLEAPYGSAWLADSPRFVDSIPAGLAAGPDARLWILESDVKVLPELERLRRLGDCDGRQLGSLRELERYFSAEIGVGAGPECVLAFAVNYAENLAAYDAETNQRLPLIPVNGSLAGVLLDGAARKVLLRAESQVPAWAGNAAWLGWALLLLLPLAWAKLEFSRRKW